ncbi:hypothetical protein YC2023_042127 [Brassica napus]|uniref:(rape) hypothetical protein n=1 Tax=Brassica napus TaxID=3708 RepID=A0A816IRH5_BRANA|nr:unnamed protein product [Brassica napus]
MPSFLTRALKCEASVNHKQNGLSSKSKLDLLELVVPHVVCAESLLRGEVLQRITSASLRPHSSSKNHLYIITPECSPCGPSSPSQSKGSRATMVKFMHFALFSPLSFRCFLFDFRLADLHQSPFDL